MRKFYLFNVVSGDISINKYFLNIIYSFLYVKRSISNIYYRCFQSRLMRIINRFFSFIGITLLIIKNRYYINVRNEEILDKSREFN